MATSPTRRRLAHLLHRSEQPCRNRITPHAAQSMGSATNCPSGGERMPAAFCTRRSSRAELTAAVRSSAAAAAPHLSTVSRSTTCRPATAASRAALSSPGRLCSQPSSSAVKRSPAGRRGRQGARGWYNQRRQMPRTAQDESGYALLHTPGSHLQPTLTHTPTCLQTRQCTQHTHQCL